MHLLHTVHVQHCEHDAKNNYYINIHTNVQQLYTPVLKHLSFQVELYLFFESNSTPSSDNSSGFQMQYTTVELCSSSCFVVQLL